MKKRFKTFIVILTLIPWSLVLVILTQIKTIISKSPKLQVIEVNILPKDTITIRTQDSSFLNKPPKEGLKEALDYYGLHHQDIVYKQAIIETGNFTSKLCKQNNLFGLYDSKNHKYYTFNHWSESVIAYKKWIQSKYKDNTDYYIFLENLGYAQDKKKYTKILKQIQDE